MVESAFSASGLAWAGEVKRNLHKRLLVGYVDKQERGCENNLFLDYRNIGDYVDEV